MRTCSRPRDMRASDSGSSKPSQAEHAAGADTGAVREILAPLDPRLVAPTPNPSDLAAAVEQAVELEADVRGYAVANFSWNRVTERWERLLFEIRDEQHARVDVLGAPLDPLTLDECIRLVDDAIAARHGLVHTSVNAAKIVRLQQDEALRESLW